MTVGRERLCPFPRVPMRAEAALRSKCGLLRNCQHNPALDPYRNSSGFVPGVRASEVRCYSGITRRLPAASRCIEICRLLCVFLRLNHNDGCTPGHANPVVHFPECHLPVSKCPADATVAAAEHAASTFVSSKREDNRFLRTHDLITRKLQHHVLHVPTPH